MTIRDKKEAILHSINHVAVKKFQDSWYEFKYWKHDFGCMPVKLLESDDYSESYTMDRIHLFLLESGAYAYVRESGCSCYDAQSDAHIVLYGNKEEAYRTYNAQKREYKNRSY